MAEKKQTIPLSHLLLALLMLLCLPAPSCQEAGYIFDWVNQQPANAVGEDAGCAKKDAALSSAEAMWVNNLIDPDPDMTEEPSGYKTIGESIANIPDGSTKRYTLTLKSGKVYREKLFLGKSKPFVTLRSEDPYNPAVIVWNDTAATAGKDGKAPWHRRKQHRDYRV